jgi:DNA-binding NarL/FixJ family response regulator
MPINVLLVDGPKLFREGLSALLEKHADFKVVGEADAVPAAPKLVKALAPDIVVLILSTRSAARSIEGVVSTGARVIVLAFHADPEFVRDVLKAGAAACLTRDSESAELIATVRSAVAKQTHLSPTVAADVVAGCGLPRGKRELSSREREILQRVADGQTTKGIASALGVSGKTIETHRRRMMEKLGLHTVAELTKYAVRAGLTSLEMRA